MRKCMDEQLILFVLTLFPNDNSYLNCRIMRLNKIKIRQRFILGRSDKLKTGKVDN